MVYNNQYPYYHIKFLSYHLKSSFSFRVMFYFKDLISYPMLWPTQNDLRLGAPVIIAANHLKPMFSKGKNWSRTSLLPNFKLRSLFQFEPNKIPRSYYVFNSTNRGPKKLKWLKPTSQQNKTYSFVIFCIEFITQTLFVKAIKYITDAL